MVQSRCVGISDWEVATGTFCSPQLRPVVHHVYKKCPHWRERLDDQLITRSGNAPNTLALSLVMERDWFCIRISAFLGEFRTGR